MKCIFSKKSHSLKIVMRKVCKLIQEKECVKCFNLKGNTCVDIHRESGGRHSSVLRKAVTRWQNLAKKALSSYDVEEEDKLHVRASDHTYFIWECVPTWSEHINKHSISCWQCFVLNTSICKNKRSTLFIFSILCFIQKTTAMWFELWIYWRQLWWTNSQGMCKKWLGKFLLGYEGVYRGISPYSFFFPLAPFTL